MLTLNMKIIIKNTSFLFFTMVKFGSMLAFDH